MSGLEQRPGERLPHWLERLWADPLMDGATPAEVAAIAGCKATDAATARRRLDTRLGLYRCHAHAEAVAEAVGWPFHDPTTLITVALESYLKKVAGRSPAPEKARGGRDVRELGSGGDSGR